MSLHVLKSHISAGEILGGGKVLRANNVVRERCFEKLFHFKLGNTK